MWSKTSFIQLMLAKGVLVFGEFKLKSGRVAPYFFNLGKMHDAESLIRLGEFYAEAMITQGVDADVIFGPAYKGIALCLSTAFVLQQRGINLSVSFNRKEAKLHGEGGMFLGADIKGKRVVLLDDVLTAGTAITDSVNLLNQAGAHLIAVFVALDRQEKSSQHPRISTVEFLSQDLHIPIHALVNFSDVLAYLHQQDPLTVDWAAIEAYRKNYGVCKG